ncbi:hypothetical protein Ato02nite_001470 [Paractinoplanes toevensis]|uniref:LTD domain-containing protein n=1 Tax=Paractinoplanes toevensis TaxID=571911 RepID=A0A919VZQ8_9ACTN|nr:hypothetical protein Ato02nite_001470 [Actinoplanes toevensis]
MRIRRILVALAMTPAIFGIAAPAYAAAPAVSFTKIQYNSPGTDTRSNASLNAEWVRLTNNTSKAIQLKNWTVRDKSNHVFKLPTVTVAARANLYIHTGKGTAYSGHIFWQSGNYIWNNTGDTATLRNTAGKTIDTCTWKSGTAPTNC